MLSRRKLSTGGDQIGYESDGAGAKCQEANETEYTSDADATTPFRVSSLSKVGQVPMNTSKVNQDRCWVLEKFGGKDTGMKYFGVADGHGIRGHDVSELVKVQLPQLLNKQPCLQTDPAKALREAYKIMNDTVHRSKIDISFSGTTCVSVLVHDKKIYCANVGDSRAIIGSSARLHAWTTKELSRDHKPDDPVERQRIISKGGRVMPYKGPRGELIGPSRVWLKNQESPGLAMSRSFGDKIAASVGVSAEPDIVEAELTANDRIVVLASDGVWEFLSNDDVMGIVSAHYANGTTKTAVEQLCARARYKWLDEEEVIDDITAVVIFLKHTAEK
jgi:serine/threonine protein phosphatase PrpC